MTNIMDLIGQTPLIKLEHVDTGPCELFIKMECQNPGGSLKDRIAVSMIAEAEQQGKLKPGGLIIEATAGNTGIALVQAAIQKGYKVLLVIPDKMSKEKIDLLRMMGAQVVMTRSDVTKGHPEYYQEIAKRLAAETPNAYYIAQFENPANPKAHEETTAPEIWEQMQHKIDAIVVGVGTGGHLTGIGRFMQKVAPQVKMILADPEGSNLADVVRTGKIAENKKNAKWFVEGIGQDYVPKTCDISLAQAAIVINDAEAFATARELLKKEAIFAGSSSGTAIAAALKYCRQQKAPQRVVTFAYDSGNKYLSKMYNNEWMKNNGFQI